MAGGQSCQRSRDGRRDGDASQDRFVLQVRDALLHLHDPAYLETHPLGDSLTGDRAARKAISGRMIRQSLLEAIEALSPEANTSGLARHSQLIRLRYVEGLDVRDVYDRMAISRTEFYREHRRAVESVASVLRRRWGIGEPADETAAGEEQRASGGSLPNGKNGQSVSRADRPAHNLPLQLTSFIGRESEVAEIRSLLSAARLLTLSGTGGCGKTRLALQVAAEVLDEYPDGVWLVELATQTDRALVPQTVATTLGLREEPGKPIVAMLSEHLRSKRALLVLDNCEHLLQACGELVNSLLRGCVNLKILANSRESLGVAGEISWRVPSLKTPQPGQIRAIDQLYEYEATRLFVERAAAVRPGYSIGDRDASAIASICWRLDGMPLAIELAAARVRILAVDQIAARLDDRFRLLTGGVRTALPRQQTLRAAIDWSYAPLTEVERKVFGRLAVFAGGCDLESAEAVCSGDGVDSADVLDVLSALSDKSLIVVAEVPGAARYRLLETIRQYALDRLLESGEAEATRGRHRDWFVALAERAALNLGGYRQGEWLDRLADEAENLRAALEWSLGGAAEPGLRLGSSLWLFWRVRGHIAEGRRWLELALANAHKPSAFRAEAFLGLGVITADLGDYALGQACCSASLDDFREIGDQRGAGRALRHAGATLMFQRDYSRAETLLGESLAILEEVGDERDIAWTLRYVGANQAMNGDPERGRASVERCLELLRRVGDKHAMAWVLQQTVDTAIREGLPNAESLIEEELAIARDVGDRRAIGAAVGQMAVFAFRRGDLAQAKLLTEESRSLCSETGFAQGVTLALTAQALLARLEGDEARAWGKLRECLSMMERGRITVAGGDALAVAGLLAADRSAYGQSVRLMASSSVNDSNPWPASRFGMWETGEFQSAIDSARVELGPEEFAMAWAEGQAMELERAIEYALSLRLDVT